MTKQTPTITLPPIAEAALNDIEKAGYEAWCVGGFVRDTILGRETADIDIATNATWDVIKSLFEPTGALVLETGIKHGTVTVIIDSFPLEITTYRNDGTYADHRHPNQVSFVKSIEEDLARRDFTMNAIAYHPDRGYIDPFGGMNDIEARLIRAVGNPSLRFEEDALRIIRGVRFASHLGFSIENSTALAMNDKAPLLEHVAHERLYSEVTKLFEGAHVHDALMRYIDILGVIIPEALPMKNFDQKTPYHIYDVLEHTAYVMQNTPSYPLVRWAAFFHDIGKPKQFFTDENGVGHFYGHAKVSVQIAQKVAQRLKMPRKLTHDMLLLIKVHDDVVAPTSKSVKRMIRKLDGDIQLFLVLCDLKKGDAAAQAPQCSGRIALAEELARVAQLIIEENQAFSLSDLAVSGNDLLFAGIEKGPQIGKLLEQALNAVIDEHISNEKDEIMSYLGLS